MRRFVCCVVAALAFGRVTATAQQPLSLIDVPFISQSEALCGGAAVAMVLRYWGAQGLSAETFAPLVDRSAAGISTAALVSEVRRRGFAAVEVRGDAELLRAELAKARPVIALIEDRPGTFHYVVVVGWHARGVVIHDPARAPFRVMTVDDFDRRWAESDRWLLLATSGAGVAGAREAGRADAVDSAGRANGDTPCERLIAEGVEQAQAGRLDAAERLLSAAIACPGSAAQRELAGVRLMQRRWGEVDTLASAAVAHDAADSYSWKLLGTARFVSGNPLGALDAWNRAGEPRLDLIRVDGLDRTRQRPVERLLDVTPGIVLSADVLRRAQRQLAELPSARSTAVTYVPAANGLAQLRVSVAERPLLPRGLIELGALGVTTAATRELAIGIGAPTGGGERITVGWRFWPNRPRYSVAVNAPAGWGGTWGMAGFSEEQPFTGGAVATAQHSAAELTFARWLTGLLRWEAGGGIAWWDRRGAFGLVRGGVRWLAPSERFDVRVDGRTWLARTRFGSWQTVATARTSSESRGTVLVGTVAAAGVSSATPFDQWTAADSGSARPILLRAHPVLDRGHLRVERLGRQVTGASIELQRWWHAGLFRLGPALFADAARTSQRLAGTSITDFDLGAGLRLRVPGLAGTLRIDAGRGLRDRATALSLVYQP